MPPVPTTETQTITLEIVPCVDSLLYAPVQLAIIGLAEHFHATIEDSAFSEITFSLNNGGPSVSIKYGRPPTGGDEGVLSCLRENSANDRLYMGICDPITVIQKNREECDNKEAGGPLYKIIGVFINRIALSLVAAKRQLPKQGSERYKKLKQQGLYTRYVALNQILTQLKDDGLNPKGLLKNTDRKSEVKYDFWSKGRTTQYLAHYFLEIAPTGQSESDDEAVAERKVANTPERKVADTPEFEGLDALLSGQADIAVTHAPWSIKSPEIEKKFEFLCRECFPSIEFPFSGIVVPAKGYSEQQELLLETFVAALFEGLIYVKRHSQQAVDRLNSPQWREFFRNYGLDNTLKVQGTASNAINYFQKIGCFAETLIPQWNAWEYAFAMDPEWDKKLQKKTMIEGKEGSLVRFTWDVLYKSIDQKFVNKLPTDDEYLSGLRRHFLKRAKEEQQPRRNSPK